jgi:hypothetical protein
MTKTLMRKVVLASVLTVSCSTIACTGSDGGVTSPGSVESSPVLPPGQSPPNPASCDATKAQFAIGGAANDELLEAARVAATASVARFLRPNEPVTMEFLAWRLNLNLNERGIVESATCG